MSVFISALDEPVAEMLDAIRPHLLALASPSRAPEQQRKREELQRLASAMPPVALWDYAMQQTVGDLPQAVSAAATGWMGDRDVQIAERRLAQFLLALDVQPAGRVPWLTFEPFAGNLPPTTRWAEEALEQSPTLLALGNGDCTVLTPELRDKLLAFTVHERGPLSLYPLSDSLSRLRVWREDLVVDVATLSKYYHDMLNTAAFWVCIAAGRSRCHLCGLLRAPTGHACPSQLLHALQEEAYAVLVEPRGDNRTAFQALKGTAAMAGAELQALTRLALCYVSSTEVSETMRLLAAGFLTQPLGMWEVSSISMQGLQRHWSVPHHTLESGRHLGVRVLVEVEPALRP